jgi:hypothetical protein
MSEEKVIQHTKKAIHAVGNKEQSWMARIKEFLYEIIIIVLAVSITLWMHNWNDRSHEKELEKNFFIGIRDNLKSDTAGLKSSIDFMNTPIEYYDSVLAQVHSGKIDSDYINNNSVQLINDLHFVSDNGLFESFKSAGNLRLIENQKILSEITTLYTSDIPFLQEAEQHTFNAREEDYSQYIGTKYGIDGNWNSPIASHLNDVALLFHIQKYDIFLKEMNRHRQNLINEITPVLKDLNEELEKRFDVKDNK